MVSVSVMFFATAARADQSPLYPGPIEAAAVVRILDGDTVVVAVAGADGSVIDEKIRLLAVDTPELHSPGCPDEFRRAMVARNVVAELIAGKTVRLTDVRRGRDRYGRTLARVLIPDADLSALLVASGLGRAYDGGKRQGWCDAIGTR